MSVEEKVEKRPLDILNHFIFNNTKHKVTILWEDGEPLFRASDIAKILEIKNIRPSLEKFDSDEKVVSSTYTLGGKQNTIMLTEIGLYRFLFNSRKPIAKPLQKWVSKVIRDIQRNSIYEVENLKIELKNAKSKEIESIRKAKHDTLLATFHRKHVVYFGRIKELNGKILIKIGATKDIRTTFVERHPKDYGNIEAIHVIECKTNMDFEYFLLHHKYIRKFLYKKPVKICGGKSIEVIHVSEEEFKKVLLIANRNVRKYPNAAPDIDAQLLKIKQSISEINEKISKGKLIPKEKEDIEITEADLLSAIPTPKKRKPSKKKTISKNIENTEADLLAVTPIPVKRKSSKRVQVRKMGTGKCSKCKVNISNRAIMCLKCVKQVRKFEITKEKMHDLIWVQKLPITAIGKMYSVSGTSIRRRCVKLGVKIRPPDTKKVCKRVREKGTSKCSDCNTNISIRAKKCVNCYKQKKGFQITKNELHNLVWIQKLPYTEIARKYGVSDTTIRKKCKALDVKVRKRVDC